MWTALKPGTSSKVAADGPFEAVLGKTRRTEFSRGKGKPEARSSPPGAPSLLGIDTNCVPVSVPFPFLFRLRLAGLWKGRYIRVT